MKINLQQFLVIGFTIFVLMSCRQTQPRPDLMADLDKTDSVELIYFRSPDSVRYFTYLAIADKNFISAMVQQLKQDTVPEISCLKEGKIYLFKNGEIFNTVFFGYADQECKFLRYIKNGHLYCYPLSIAFRDLLEAKKKLAKEPELPDSTGSDGQGTSRDSIAGPRPDSPN